MKAGFRVDAEEVGPGGLVHAGEQWLSPHYQIGPHRHKVWELYLQVNGTTQWLSDGQVYDLEPSHFFAVPPGVEHCQSSLPPTTHHIYFAALDVKRAGSEFPRIDLSWADGTGCIHIPDAYSLMAPFAQLARELTNDLPQPELGVLLSVEHLLLEVSRVLGPGGRGRALSSRHPAVSRACQVLEQHPEMPWTLGRLASEVGLSPNYFAQLFSEEVGCPPHRYLADQRIRRAKDVLARTDVPITDLAYELGFSSSQHFARVFKAHTGCSARVYRKTSRQGQYRPPSGRQAEESPRRGRGQPPR